MKLLRLKITDEAGFRSLPAGFEHWFQPEWRWDDNPDAADDGFAPFVCAGPNGSGKSNLLDLSRSVWKRRSPTGSRSRTRSYAP